MYATHSKKKVPVENWNERNALFSLILVILKKVPAETTSTEDIQDIFTYLKLELDVITKANTEEYQILEESKILREITSKHPLYLKKYQTLSV